MPTVLQFFDTKLGACLFACTETESASLGRFLNYLLVDAERWRRDEAAFNSEAIGPNPAKANVPLDGMKLVATRYVDWGSFKRLCRKWHNRVLTVCDTSTRLANEADTALLALRR